MKRLNSRNKSKVRDCERTTIELLSNVNGIVSYLSNPITLFLFSHKNIWSLICQNYQLWLLIGQPFSYTKSVTPMMISYLIKNFLELKLWTPSSKTEFYKAPHICQVSRGVICFSTFYCKWQSHLLPLWLYSR